jgi:DNA helicase-2/ATP-dependent DNA helicase PcrA
MAEQWRLLDQLNEQQRKAVLENSHPLLVLAGAGSGKTRVITTKIAYAVEQLGIAPYRILAVTFTNKAAKEMKDRVHSMVQGSFDIQQCNIRTFHSFGAWLLRRFGSEIGLGSNFSIYDDKDSLSLLASCFPNYKKKELDPVMRKISYAKDRGLGPSDNLSSLGVDATFKRMFETYERKLHQVGNVDFADLIVRSNELLDSSTSVLNWVHNRFCMILVDEYQDSNLAQFNLLRKLVGPHCFICVVGDDDQSIYRFRGAEIKNILSFAEQYANAKTVKLEQNYRSTQHILAVANSVISNNKARHPKALWTANTKGTKPTLLYVQDEQDEALRVASIVRQDRNYNESAVLYRTNAQSVAFETVFKRLGIPYKVVGALQFYEREEVKDALSLLFLLTNAKDEVNFKRMINKPARGIGPGALETILSYSLAGEGDLLRMLQKAIEANALSAKAKAGAVHFIRMYEHAHTMLREGELVDCVNFLIRESGLLEHYLNQDRLNSTSKAENLEALVNALSSYDSSADGLQLFLEQLSLDPTTLGTEDPRDKEGVTLITMHNTKGLEFDRVFVSGLEEELFPGRSSESEEDVEEERRIFYVAVTRARNDLYLLCARSRKIWGKTNFQTPSRFLEEIPSELCKTEGKRSPQVSYREPVVKPHWGTGGGNLIQQGFGKKAKVFSMNTEHQQTKGSVLFPVGQRVYSDSYGEGEVTSLKMSGDREVIEVCFSTGRKATFISKFAQLEKIGGE